MAVPGWPAREQLNPNAGTSAGTPPSPDTLSRLCTCCSIGDSRWRDSVYNWSRWRLRRSDRTVGGDQDGGIHLAEQAEQYRRPGFGEDHDSVVGCFLDMGLRRATSRPARCPATAGSPTSSRRVACLIQGFRLASPTLYVRRRRTAVGRRAPGSQDRPSPGDGEPDRETKRPRPRRRGHTASRGATSRAAGAFARSGTCWPKLATCSAGMVRRTRGRGATLLARTALSASRPARAAAEFDPGLGDVVGQEFRRRHIRVDEPPPMIDDPGRMCGRAALHRWNMADEVEGQNVVPFLIADLAKIVLLSLEGGVADQDADPSVTLDSLGGSEPGRQDHQELVSPCSACPRPTASCPRRRHAHSDKR